MNHFGIDVYTKDKAKLMTRLKGLVSTVTVTVADGGEYRADRSYSQVWLTTNKTEAQLDAWLYKTKGIEYVGIFKREES